jgi:hypothetical protein
VEYVKKEAKIVYLLECLQKTAPPVIIFCERKSDVDDIHEYLLLKVRYLLKDTGLILRVLIHVAVLYSTWWLLMCCLDSGVVEYSCTSYGKLVLLISASC